MPKLAEAARNERRQALIDAAWRCATRKGFQATTVDDVCIEAGVSKGAFYVYFDMKQDLLLALLEDDAQFYEKLIERLSRVEQSAVRRLRAYARAVVERSSDSSRVQVTADLWTEMLTHRVVRKRFASSVQRRRERIREWIEQSIAAGELRDIPPNAFASILLALTDGLLLHGSLEPAAFRWANIERALGVLFEGIST